MQLNELKHLVTEAVGTATKRVLSQAALRTQIKKAQAYRLYGRHNVDRWIAEKLIDVAGNSISRNQIAAIANSSNRVTYQPAKKYNKNE